VSDPPTLPGLLARAASGRGVVSVLGAEREEAGIGELWRRSEHAAACVLDAVGPGGAVALLLETSLDCLVSLLGALRAGVTTLSLPHPARSASPEAHRRQVLDAIRLAGAGLLLRPDRLAGLDLGDAARTASFRECAAHPHRADVAEAGELVQFSSGSTGRPKGARLASAAVAANVTAILDHVAPHDRGVVACSWLPLSHDMGLVGMCLTGLVAMGPPWRGRRLALMPPERMVARPSRWLQACSEIGATVTAAPTFALDLLLAHARALPAGLDLRPLRVLFVGSEPVPPGTLRRFGAATAPVGLDEAALCPAYGMAEASVAVTMARPGEPWRSTSAGPDGAEVVSCGIPLGGLEVRAPAGPGAPGPIAVRGASLLAGYLGRAEPALDAGGWFETSDLGFLGGGELHVVGRADDVLVIAGRKLHPEPLEAAAARQEAVRPGGCAAIPDGSGGFVVVAERRRASARADLREACRWIRRELSVEAGVAPTAVVIVGPGSLPRTPSGKLQRRRLGHLRRRGELPVEAELRFGRV
jgi:acyl-CoA synthetase (AMP-forming)/AMP-acid ligase II